jgi:hypothetical protein
MQDIPPYTTFAIGSFPFDSAEEALQAMGGSLDIPAAPQMVRLSPWEDMLLGAVDGIPFVSADGESRVITAPLAGREESLARFYELYYSGDFSFLERAPRASAGWSAFVKRAESDPGFGRSFLKTQVVGPLTFGQSVKVEGAFSLADDPSLLEAASFALGAKAAGEAAVLRKLGRTPVVFFDEPGLSGYGSAFSTLSEERVLASLGSALEALRSKGEAYAGCHVCGNTDWGLLARAGLDVINCDAYEYLESVALYPREIKSFLEGGGYLAWGVAPTTAWDPRITPDDLCRRLADGLQALAKHGVPLELLKARALLTSSCGLGGLRPEVALAVLRLLPQVKERMLDAL